MHAEIHGAFFFFSPAFQILFMILCNDILFLKALRNILLQGTHNPKKYKGLEYGQTGQVAFTAEPPKLII